ncbi:MAG: RNA-processing protein [Candidatus Micrarchaeota archaeon]
MKLVCVEPRRLAMFSRRDSSLLKEISERTNTTMRIVDDNIEIQGEAANDYFAELVINAICLGFESRKAFKLLNDEYFLEVIDLKQVVSRNEKRVTQYKARLIGSEGKARKTLEELSGALLSIWGNKIAVIGKYDEIKNVKEAIKMLLEGRKHIGVYAFLERKQRNF